MYLLGTCHLDSIDRGQDHDLGQEFGLRKEVWPLIFEAFRLLRNDKDKKHEKPLKNAQVVEIVKHHTCSLVQSNFNQLLPCF